MTQDNDTSRQDALREVMELLGKATPGPWLQEGRGISAHQAAHDPRCEYWIAEEVNGDSRRVATQGRPSDNAAAIAAAVNWLRRFGPALLSGGGDDTAVVAKSAMTGWSGWATQYPGKMPRLFGQRWIAEMNWYPHEGDGHALIRLVEVERIDSAPTMPTTPEASK